MDLRPEVKSSFWDLSFLIIAHFLSALLSIACLSLITRMLGPEGYGKFSLFQTISLFFFFLGINWTNTAVMRYGKEEFLKTGKINETFWARNILLLFSILICASSFGIFSGRISSFLHAPGDGSLLFLVFLYILSFTLLEYLKYIFQGLGQFKKMALIWTEEYLLMTLFLCFMLKNIILGKDSEGVIIAALLSTVISTITGLAFLRIEWFFPFHLNPIALKRIFLFSYPLILGSASIYFIDWIDVWVINQFLPLTDLGIYQVAYRGMMVIQYLAMQAVTVITPLMVSFLTEDREDLILLYLRRIVPQLFMAWAFLVALVLVIAKVFIPIIFGLDFSKSYGPFSFLMLGVSFYGMISLLTPLIITYELIQFSTGINVLMGILKLTFDLILVPRLGIYGAALSTGWVFLFGAVGFSMIVRKKLKTFSFLKSLIFIIPVIFTFLSLTIWEGMGGYGVAGFFVLISYPWLSRISQIFSREDRRFIEVIDMPWALKKFIFWTYGVMS